jgi:hypothetical protein
VAEMALRPTASKIKLFLMEILSLFDDENIAR